MMKRRKGAGSLIKDKQMKNGKHKGFTLLETLVCIVIIGVLITVVVKSMSRFNEDLPIATAMKDMDIIKTAIVEGVYPDIGYIPCATKDTDTKKRIETLFIPAYLFLGYEEIKGMINTVDEWDRYSSKGWRGPYIKAPGTTIDAAYFDEESFPEGSDDKPVYLPAMLTPWADKSEEMAREVEAKGIAAAAYKGYCSEQNLTPEECAMEYRKGKYYQLLYPQVTRVKPIYEYKEIEINKWRLVFTGWEKSSCMVSKEMAYIVCRGADCLPPEFPYVDVAAYLQCEAKIKETAIDECMREVANQCKDKTQHACNPVEKLKTCMKEKYEAAYSGCYEGDAVPLETRLSIRDPGNNYYMDVDDDIIMSIFGGIIRSPMEK